MLISIGIDNGLHGAIVSIDESFKVLHWYDCPISISKTKSKGKTKSHSEFSPRGMADILRTMSTEYQQEGNYIIKVWLEQAQAMPKQGLSSTFKTGKGAGLWEGIVAGLDLPYDIVRANTWTKEVLRDIPRGDPKQRSFIKCQRMFPDLPLTKPNGRVLSMDGRSDAALIAYYGMLMMKGAHHTPPEEQSVARPKKKPVKKKR